MYNTLNPKISDRKSWQKATRQKQGRDKASTSSTSEEMNGLMHLVMWCKLQNGLVFQMVHYG